MDVRAIRAEAAEHAARCVAARALPGCALEIERDGPALHLSHLYVSPRGGFRGTGLATRLLAAVLAATDAHGVPVTLEASATGEPGDPDLFALLRRYGAFGFEATGLNERDWVRMERAPRAPAGAAGILRGYLAARASDPPTDGLLAMLERFREERDAAEAAAPGMR